MIDSPFTEVIGIYRIIGRFAGTNLDRLEIYSNVTNALMSKAIVQNGAVALTAEHLLPEFVKERVKQIFSESGAL